MCVNKTEGKLYETMKQIYPMLTRQFKQDWCKKLLHLPFDFCIPEYKIIIELDGAQHFRQIRDWSSPEEQFENDKSDIWFALVPTDAPFIPIEYIDNFIENPHINNSVCISRINNKIEPMFSFWSIKTLEIIEKELIKSDGVKIMKIAEDLKYDIIDFKTVNEIEFMNINTNEDYLKIKNLSRESD